MARRALVLLLALTACTSSSPPRATGPSPRPSGSSAIGLPSTSPSSESSPAAAPTYRQLPANVALSGFVPESVTFVSTRTGWFLGTQKCGIDTCGVLLQTRDGGRTFRRLTPPPVQARNVRFGDLQEGWAFGDGHFKPGGNPGLWRTHDGGRHWKKVLADMVSTLEVSGATVWAIDDGPDGVSPRVLRGSTHGDALRLVAQGGNRSAWLTVGQGTVYVVGQQGAGPIATNLLVISSDGRQRNHPSPCDLRAGSDPLLAVAPTGRVVAVCGGESSTGGQRKSAYVSTDQARSWTKLPDPPVAGYTGPFNHGSLTATTAATLFSGDRSPIYRRVGGGPWRAVLPDRGGNGFGFVGMTDDLHGVALGQRAAWMTADGGDTWRRLEFR